MFVISIWFVQSFVEFKVIAGRQILVIYIPRVYSNKIYRSYVLGTYNIKFFEKLFSQIRKKGYIQYLTTIEMTLH